MLWRALPLITLATAACAASSAKVLFDRAAMAPLPNLYVLPDGCPVPLATVPLDSTGAGPAFPHTLRVDLRSDHLPDWRGDGSVRLIGPLGGATRDRAISARGGTIVFPRVPAGRYVMRSIAIAHHARVDTLVVGEAGLTVVAPLKLLPSHSCGLPGDIIVKPSTARAPA
jgi:hypothetical protein